jgi:hypothetical protein
MEHAPWWNKLNANERTDLIFAHFRDGDKFTIVKDDTPKQVHQKKALAQDALRRTHAMIDREWQALPQWARRALKRSPA